MSSNGKVSSSVSKDVCLRGTSPGFASMKQCPFSKSTSAPIRINMLEPIIRSRKVLALGKGDVPDYTNGTKVTFHFKTVAIYDGVSHTENGHTDEEKDKEHSHEHKDTVVDDSKATGNNKPMEMFIGKQFKLPLWEEWIKNMRVGERSQITFDWRFCGDVYPLLSKSYRNYCRPQLEVDYETEADRMKRTSNHCCGMQSKAGHGYEDLNHLTEHPPKQLEFTLELLSVESPENVDKEIWLMNEEEMRREYPQLRKEGNDLFAKKEYEPASYKYRKGLAILEQLKVREKPNDVEWLEYESAKIPFLLNLSQCELFLGKFYDALEHTSEVVKQEPANVKALFRRGKANAAVWNVAEARADFAQALQLDASLSPLVKGELADLEERLKEKDSLASQLLKGKLFS